MRVGNPNTVISSRVSRVKGCFDFLCVISSIPSGKCEEAHKFVEMAVLNTHNATYASASTVYVT